MKIIKILAICFLSFLSSSLVGQDVIIKKNGKKLKVQVKEINDTQVKYIEVGDPNEILFTIDRALIKEIKFSYGGKYKEEEPEANQEYFAEDHNNNIMVNFTAIGNNALILGYERAINQGSSYDIQLKLLGFGIEDGSSRQTSGVGIDLGYKFKFGSFTKKAGEYRPKHLMHGSYFKPLLGFATGSVSNSSQNFSLGHFGIQIGKQWIIQKQVSLDLYIGFHYYTGADGGNSPFDFIESVDLGDFGGGNHRAASFGFRVGYLFGRYGYENEKKSRR